MVASRDLSFLWGMMSMVVSPVGVCSEWRESKDERIGEQVFRRVYPVFKGRLNTDVDSMWLM